VIFVQSEIVQEFIPGLRVVAVPKSYRSVVLSKYRQLPILPFGSVVVP
jgi:hypothetical protein